MSSRCKYRFGLKERGGVFIPEKKVVIPGTRTAFFMGTFNQTPSTKFCEARILNLMTENGSGGPTPDPDKPTVFECLARGCGRKDCPVAKYYDGKSTLEEYREARTTIMKNPLPE